MDPAQAMAFLGRGPPPPSYSGILLKVLKEGMKSTQGKTLPRSLETFLGVRPHVAAADISQELPPLPFPGKVEKSKTRLEAAEDQGENQPGSDSSGGGGCRRKGVAFRALGRRTRRGCFPMVGSGVQGEGGGKVWEGPPTRLGSCSVSPLPASSKLLLSVTDSCPSRCQQAGRKSPALNGAELQPEKFDVVRIFIAHLFS